VTVYHFATKLTADEVAALKAVEVTQDTPDTWRQRVVALPDEDGVVLRLSFAEVKTLEDAIHAYCDDNSSDKALDLMGNALKVAWRLRDNPVLVASGGRPSASLAKHIAIALWLGVVMTILAIVFAVNAKAADVQVIDGDTFKMNGITYRLHGIDAPEGDQVCNGLDSAWHCGDEAVAALLALVAGRMVRCRPLGRDHYDRVLAKCRAGRIEINDALVRWGVAWACLGCAQSAPMAVAQAKQVICFDTLQRVEQALV